MKTFINVVRIAKKNKGLVYWYDGNGYVYSPCRDLYGQPVMNFREKKGKGDRERYGEELSNKDRMSFYKVRILTR